MNTIDIQGRYVIYYHDGQNERITCDSHEAAIERAAEIEAGLAEAHERQVAQLHAAIVEKRDVTIPHVGDWGRWRLCDDGSGQPVPCTPDPVEPVPPPPVFEPDPGSPLVGGHDDDVASPDDVGVFAGDPVPLNGAERPLPPPPAPSEPEPQEPDPEPEAAPTGLLPTADSEWHPDTNRLTVTIDTATEVKMWRKFGDRSGEFDAKPGGAPRHFKGEPGWEFELRLFNESGPLVLAFTAPGSEDT